MEIRSLSLERYKGYAGRTDFEIAPLTILVGSNNAGKSALARVFQLMAGGLAAPERGEREPLPLASGGVRHGNGFEDLVAGRPAHGRVRLGAAFSLQSREIAFEVEVRNVEADQSSERQISEWRLRDGDDETTATRLAFDRNSEYEVSEPGSAPRVRAIAWRGLLPTGLSPVASAAESCVDALRDWASGVRHLQCPRALHPSPFRIGETAASTPDARGRNAPLALASDDGLRRSVRDWYRDAFGVSLEVRAQGTYSELVVRDLLRGADVQLAHAGAGLSQVLPVVVAALTAKSERSGVEIIEHPEAELHPRAHAVVAELLLDCLPGSRRPLIVETHSEMLLLRARRWIAEGRLAPDQVLVYWIAPDPARGSTLRKIRITEEGDMDSWPDDVFTEPYEEILAIRRAARARA